MGVVGLLGYLVFNIYYRMTCDIFLYKNIRVYLICNLLG